MQTALKNIEIAQLKAKQAKLNWLPNVDATLANRAYQYRSADFYSSASSRYYSEKGTEAPNTLYNYTMQNISGISVSWEIDIWRKFRDQNK